MDHTTEFASWTAFVDASKQPQNGNGTRTSRDVGNENWTGTKTFEEAISLAEKGWPEGLKKISDLSSLFVTKVSEKMYRKEAVYSLVGPGTLNMSAYLSGYPAPFVVLRDTETEIDAPIPRGILRMVVQIFVPAAASTESIFWRGAAATALADLLERHGYRVEIVGILCGANSPRTSISQTIVTLKRASQPVNLETLAFVFAHNACFRRIGFGVGETYPPEVRREYGLGLDSAYYWFNTDVPKGNRGDIYIGKNEYWFTREEVVTWITAQLKNQGIELEV
jgi:hypothetical protein